MAMRDDIERVLITEDEILAKVKELSATLDKDYKDVGGNSSASTV